jgi:DNA-binding CsgD family transcriptional regulator/PAS domain-containing protein
MIDLEGVSAQALSDTIGAIYDCSLDPQRWFGTITRIGELCASTAGGICVHDLKHVDNVRLFEVGYSQEFSETFQKHYDGSPLAAGSILAEVGEVNTLARMSPDEELLESRFYREALKPFGILDFIGFMALRTGARIASIHATRTERESRYGDRDINLFKLLSPHVCRALAISDALDIRTLKSEMLEATLNGLVAGVYLLARDGRVVYVNAAAERQLKAGNAVRIANGRLVPVDQAARGVLAKAIVDAASQKTDSGSQSRSFALPDPGGAGLLATLLALDRENRQNVVTPFMASIAVFVQEPAQVPLMPGEAFARLYGLTGGELRVLLALAQGLGGKEAADMLGIGEPTMRTHLQRIFSKTSTSRQTELLQSAAPPIRAA